MIEKRTYRQCTRCVMDTTDPDIEFNGDGMCSHCRQYNDNVYIRTINNNHNERLLKLVNKIKKTGRGKEYDCIIGVSGGVDSTYVAYKCKELGLNPLAVHFDNGWDSELAIKNIENVLNKLEIDLYTYVVNWEEFKDLQLSFLKASTSDSEIPTDHAIYALLMKTASKRGIKYVISGMSYQTESIMPISWSYGHSDWKYIKNIHKIFGNMKLRTFPRYTLFYLFYIAFIRRIKFVSLLNYFEYDKEEAMKILVNSLNWKNYGGKHQESIYTRFFQAYILPVKFNIDKRKAHLSNLINSGQISRDEALENLREYPFSNQEVLEDKKYVIKKLGLTEEIFEEIMSLPQKSFYHYPNNYLIIKKVKKVINFFRRKGFLPK